ncbi:YggS family pyridoxal phosphate-dependent enzyme [Dehalogenimonas sp. 4OHTPN]|uniref:Pyridoxal phosphate homeostasis protein n=1 Tax=Dehalogenimonas sp. 4OHTPN TaxID=3166643 RepID=A0AAU8G6X5_9CHLR
MRYQTDLTSQSIGDNVRRLLAEIPRDVAIVAAVKSRSPVEIAAALDAGISIIGENYIQDTEAARRYLLSRGCWHFIGHLQSNKVKKAVELFDVIETVDSPHLARLIDRRAFEAQKIMPVFIEVNIAREQRKSGVAPENLIALAREIGKMPNLTLKGLMTLGPNLPGEMMRPYFAEARGLFNAIKQEGAGFSDIRYLSMGTTGSYRVAIEEGANLVRLGEAIFGPRL